MGDAQRLPRQSHRRLFHGCIEQRTQLSVALLLAECWTFSKRVESAAEPSRAISATQWLSTCTSEDGVSHRGN